MLNLNLKENKHSFVGHKSSCFKCKTSRNECSQEGCVSFGFYESKGFTIQLTFHLNLSASSKGKKWIETCSFSSWAKFDLLTGPGLKMKSEVVITSLLVNLRFFYLSTSFHFSRIFKRFLFLQSLTYVIQSNIYLSIFPYAFLF